MALASEPAHRFPCFDGLRALAALSVFMFHATGRLEFRAPGYVPAFEWTRPLGPFGVAVFFVISGFLLYRPYVVAALAGLPAPALRPFWLRRFVRIFPAYWVALLFVVVVLGQFTITSVAHGVTYFGLFHIYRGGSDLLGLSVAWTLGIEVSFYVLLPGLAWLLRRAGGGVRGQLVGLALMAALGILLRYWWLFVADVPFDERWFSLRAFSSWLPAYLDWFALGMAMAVGSAWRAQGGRLPAVIDWFGRWPSQSWVLAFVCYWIVVENSATSLPAWTPAQRFIRYLFMGLAGALLVFPAVFGAQDRSALRWLLRTPVLVVLGVVSYGIYLYHLPLINAAEGWSWMPAARIVQVVVVFGLTVVAATASYWIVERPTVGWARRWTAAVRRSSRPQSSPLNGA